MIQNKYYKIGNFNKRIALFSDIHFSSDYNLEIFKEIINNLKKNKPDFICIPGDILDDSKIIYDERKIVNLTNFFKELSLIAQVIIAPGNHDFTNFVNYKPIYLSSENYFLDLKKIENIHYLNDKCLVRDNITFTGFNPDFDYYYLKPNENKNNFIEQIDSRITVKHNEYNILLCHSPYCPFQKDVLKKSKNINKFDLILSGHMHNGLTFKFLDKFGTRGLVGPFYRFFPKYSRGHAVNNFNNKIKHLIISGGIIKFSNNSPKIFQKINFLYPSHIEYIDL